MIVFIGCCSCHYSVILFLLHNDVLSSNTMTVSIVPSGGTAMAAAAADIVMMSDNLMRLPAAIKLCRLARAIIIQNCSFSIAVKIIAVVFAIMGA